MLYQCQKVGTVLFSLFWPQRGDTRASSQHIVLCRSPPPISRPSNIKYQIHIYLQTWGGLQKHIWSENLSKSANLAINNDSDVPIVSPGSVWNEKRQSEGKVVCWLIVYDLYIWYFDIVTNSYSFIFLQFAYWKWSHASYAEFCHILHFPHFPRSGLYSSIARAAGLSPLVSSGHRDFTQGTGQQQDCFRAYCACKELHGHICALV